MSHTAEQHRKKKAELEEEFRKRLYALDDIGFIGVQQDLSPAAEDRIAKKTGEAIRRLKGKINVKKKTK